MKFHISFFHGNHSEIRVKGWPSGILHLNSQLAVFKPSPPEHPQRVEAAALAAAEGREARDVIVEIEKRAA